MITIYATILEIFIEIFMNVVLAGVSLIVTLWLLFEEVTEKKENKRETLKRESPLPLQESSLDVPKRKKRPKLDSTFETETQYMQKVEIKVLLDYFNHIFFLIMDCLWLHISIYSGENS